MLALNEPPHDCLHILAVLCSSALVTNFPTFVHGIHTNLKRSGRLRQCAPLNATQPATDERLLEQNEPTNNRRSNYTSGWGGDHFVNDGSGG